MRNMFVNMFMKTALVAALACLPLCAEATVYYIGGTAPTGEESNWLEASWTNLDTQIQKLAEGDELRIATGTISRTETGWPTQTVNTASVSLTGAWDTPGGNWTRLSLTNRANYSVIDNMGTVAGDDRRTPCLIIATNATNVVVEGLRLKRGNSHDSTVPYLGGGLLVCGASATIDYCSITDGSCVGKNSSCNGLSIVGSGSNTLVRRCWFADNSIANVQPAGGANLYVDDAPGVRVTECEFYEGSDPDAKEYSVVLGPTPGAMCTMDNCVVYDSRGFYVKSGSSGYSTTEVVNVTFHTAGVCCYNNNPRAFFRNCIFSESPEWTMDTGAPNDAYVYVYDSLVDNLASRANIQTNGYWLYIDTNPAGSVTNLDIDAGYEPAFEDVASSNFVLQSTSAAIDLGQTDWLSKTYQGAVLGLSASEQTDKATNLRFTGVSVDAGAYESAGSQGWLFEVE